MTFISYSQELLDKVQTNSPEIEALYLTLPEQNVEEFAEALKQNSSIKTLCVEPTLRYPNADHPFAFLLAREQYFEPRTFELLTEGIGLSQIEHVSFPTGKFTDHAGGELAQIIRNNKLKTIGLSDNEINDVTAIEIFEALKHNTSVEYIEVSNNQITDLGAQKIAEAIQANNTLKTIYLSYNPIDTSGSIQIIEALKHNKSITHIDLCFTPKITEEAMQEVEQSPTQKLIEALDVNTRIINHPYQPFLVRNRILTQDPEMQQITDLVKRNILIHITDLLYKQYKNDEHVPLTKEARTLLLDYRYHEKNFIKLEPQDVISVLQGLCHKIKTEDPNQEITYKALKKDSVNSGLDRALILASTAPLEYLKDLPEDLKAMIFSTNLTQYFKKKGVAKNTSDPESKLYNIPDDVSSNIFGFLVDKTSPTPKSSVTNSTTENLVCEGKATPRNH